MVANAELVDTHCHIHSSGYGLPPDEVIERAKLAGVNRLLCVGTDVGDSRDAISFVAHRDNCWATVGVHPHEASLGTYTELAELMQSSFSAKIVGIGECGLDYFYAHSTPVDQKAALRYQIELALEYSLPMVFHVREAFRDFWPIFESYKGLRGVLHSFTDSRENLERALSHGLYVGVNGIMTFTKEADQLEMARAIPLTNMVLETDAPYLTPRPRRGKINESSNVSVITEFLAELRSESFAEIAAATTANARRLFSL